MSRFFRAPGSFPGTRKIFSSKDTAEKILLYKPTHPCWFKKSATRYIRLLRCSWARFSTLLIIHKFVTRCSFEMIFFSRLAWNLEIPGCPLEKKILTFSRIAWFIRLNIAWRDNPEDILIIPPVARAFHTLLLDTVKQAYVRRCYAVATSNFVFYWKLSLHADCAFRANKSSMDLFLYSDNNDE